MSRLRFHAAILSLFTSLGVVAGLVLDGIIAGRYGLNEVTDAYFIAAALPLILLATALSAGQSVLVVALTDSGEAGQAEAAGLLSALLIYSGGISLGVALLGSLSAPWLMRLLAPGRGEASLDLATQLGVILFWRTPAAWLSEVLRAALYARRHFVAAAAGNFIPSLAAVGLVLALPGRPISSIAWAITLGSWLGLVWMAGAYRYLARDAVWRWAIHHPALGRVGREWLVPLGGLLARQSVMLAERFFGSFLPPGSIAALGYANKITLAATGVLLDSLTTAALPDLARSWAGRRVVTPSHPVQRPDFAALLRLMGLVALALAVGLGLLGQVLVHFPRPALGALDADALSLLGHTLTFYSLALLPLGPFRAVQAWCYAVRRPERVALLLILAAGVTVVLDWPFSQLWGTAGLGLGLTAGLTLALAVGWRWIGKA